MNPLTDEKMVLISSALIPELLGDRLKIECIREAYGPTFNEGLCFEWCFELNFSGSVNGKLCLGSDGYTRILLLPYLARNVRLKPEEQKDRFNERLLLKLSEEFAEMFTYEMKEFVDRFRIESIKSSDHKLISFLDKEYRRYMVIFFLKDERLKKYLGRVYVMIAVEKELGST